MAPNEFVTRAELTAHLTPMKEDIHEIHGDVKILLAAHAGEVALEAKVKDGGARRISWMSLLITGIGALYWAQEAVAKAFH